jgi:hypothetical protein
LQLISKAEIGKTLQALPQKGKRELEPFKSFTKEHGIPMNILEDHEVLDNGAETHMHMSDLWYCLEGEVTFVCGGELIEENPKTKSDGTIDQNVWRAKEIKNGETTEKS